MDALKNLKAEIAEHMDAISKMFQPGNRITVVIRNPSLDDGNVVMTDDDLDEAIAAIHRMKSRDKI